MSIEFACPGCHQTLRVPQTAAGKVAKCPSCSTIVTVPDGSISFNAPQGSSPATHNDLFAASDKPAANPFADKTGKDPLRLEPIQPHQVGGVPLNPYASPSAFDSPWEGRFADGPVGNQPITVTAILNQSVALWQQHLGTLIGMTVLLVAIQLGIQLIGQELLARVLGPISWELLWAGSLLFRFGIVVVSTFLTIGQMQLCLKMCRREPFEFIELFSGGSRFVPVLLVTLLVVIPYEVLSYVVRMTLDHAMGLRAYDAVVATAWSLGLVQLVFSLLFWPYKFLVVDEKSSVLESFGMAYRVTQGNRATSFLAGLSALVILIVGALACGIGIFAAVPLAMMIMPAVAYLMMSGQMPPEGYPRQQVYR